MPSYLPRLPDRCKKIISKLGGPVAASPPKARPAKQSTGLRSKPGAATKRTIQRKTSMDLKQCLSDEKERERQERRSMSRAHSRALSVSRASPGIFIKAESDESQSIADLLQDDQPHPRSSILTSKLFARRQISMSSIQPKSKTKSEKQGLIDIELKAAISIIKKPDRSLAGKLLSESAMERVQNSKRKYFPHRSLLDARLTCYEKVAK